MDDDDDDDDGAEGIHKSYGRGCLSLASSRSNDGSVALSDHWQVGQKKKKKRSGPNEGKAARQDFPIGFVLGVLYLYCIVYSTRTEMCTLGNTVTVILHGRLAMQAVQYSTARYNLYIFPSSGQKCRPCRSTHI